jgi:chromate reductase, NAD(P)H dehydrogenase (quinone)
MSQPTNVLLISGSLRKGSTNTALLRTAQAIAPDGVETTLYEELAHLPHYDPDDDRDPLPDPVVRLRAAIHAAGAIMFCTPEYAGALPGSFKNLFEWSVGDGEPGSIYEKPVAWINASASPTGAADAHHSLRVVLGYVTAKIVEEACVRVPVTRDVVGDDGLIADQAIRSKIADALLELVGQVDPV